MERCVNGVDFDDNAGTPVDRRVAAVERPLLDPVGIRDVAARPIAILPQVPETMVVTA